MYHIFRVLDPGVTSVSFEQENFEVEDSPLGGVIVVQPHQVDRIRTAEHLRRHLAYGGPMPENGLGSLPPPGDPGREAGSSKTESQLAADHEEQELARLIAEEDAAQIDGQPPIPVENVGTDNPDPDVVTTAPAPVASVKL